MDPTQYMQMLQQLLGGIQAQAAPAVPGVPQIPQMPLVQPDLGPEEIAYFDSLTNRANQTYQQGAAQNAYQQGNLDLENTINTRDLGRKFDQFRERLPGGFQRRGLMNSGVYQQGLSDYATDRSNATTDLASRYQRAQGGLGLGLQQLGATHQTTLADIKARKTGRKNQIASTLRLVR